MHSCLDTVIGAAGQSNFKMQIIRENSLLNPFCKGRRVIISKRTHPVADAGADVSRSGRRIAPILFRLVDSHFLNDRLKHLIDCLHVIQGDAFYLKALPCGQVYAAIPIFFCNGRHLLQHLRAAFAARNTNTGGGDSAFL